MRRVRVDLEVIASMDTLAAAFWRAARGRRRRPEVEAFAADLPRSLRELSIAILDGSAPRAPWTSFVVHDPKRRTILAPGFEDRVLHHALIAHLGPVLDWGLVDDSFACRMGKGTLAAVRRAQHHTRRFPVFLKTDVRAYFASIDHGRLLDLVRRRVRGVGVLGLCDRVVRSAPGAVARGLPIGALTSQHFANLYLDGFDRLLLERLGARGYVRYMDDAVAWFDDAEAARDAYAAAPAVRRGPRPVGAALARR